MQWLIDLILDKIRLDGLVVNRGDPANHDFTAGDFTKDNTWRDLDLSAIIPENANIVYAHVVLRSPFVSQVIKFRPKGNVNERNVSHCETQVSVIRQGYDIQIFLDENRMIQYKVPPGIGLLLSFTVKGWDF